MATKISFRLRHPSLNLTDIAMTIALPIAHIWTVGEPRKTPNGDRLDGVYKDSYCTFRVTTSDGTISAAISLIDAALHTASVSHAILRSQEIDKELYCSIIDDGEVVDLDSLARLIKWSIRLALD